MGWLKEIWAEWVLLGVVAVVGTWVTYIRELHPIIVGLIWFSLLVILTRVVAKWQANKIRKRLNVQKERWGKMQEELMKLREPQRCCLNIPKSLWEMNEISINLVKEQKLTGIPKKRWGEAKIHQKFAFNTLRQLSVVLVLRNIWIGKLLKLDRWANKLLLDLSSVLKELGIGGLMVEDDEEYKAKLKTVQTMMLPLPPKITNMINGNIMLSKSLSTAYVIDLAKPMLKKWNIDMQSNFMLRFRYWADGTNILLMRSYGNITESIENYLVGK